MATVAAPSLGEQEAEPDNQQDHQYNESDEEPPDLSHEGGQVPVLPGAVLDQLVQLGGYGVKLGGYGVKPGVHGVEPGFHVPPEPLDLLEDGLVPGGGDFHDHGLGVSIAV